MRYHKADTTGLSIKLKLLMTNDDNLLTEDLRIYAFRCRLCSSVWALVLQTLHSSKHQLKFTSLVHIYKLSKYCVRLRVHLLTFDSELQRYPQDS